MLFEALQDLNFSEGFRLLLEIGAYKKLSEQHGNIAREDL